MDTHGKYWPKIWPEELRAPPICVSRKYNIDHLVQHVTTQKKKMLFQKNDNKV